MPERIPEAVPPEASERKKIVIVEASDAVEAEARDVADAKMTASPEELSGVSGFVKRIWKHNLFHEYYRQKEIGKARSQILETGNLYADETTDQARWDSEKAAIVERFTSEYEEAVHRDAGEKPLEQLGATPEANQVKADIQRIIREYAAGRLDDTAFTEERNRIFSALKGVKRDVVDKGVFFADNLHEVAKQAKQNVEHDTALDSLDLDFEVVVGKAKAGVRTEAQFNAVDRVVEKITSSKVGRFANETTIASGVALAYAAGVGLSRRIAGSKLAAWGTFGATALLGGGIAALRERKRLEEERRQHFREMAKGKRFDPDRAPRRREMEEYRYETRNAADLCENLERSLYAYDGGRRESRNLNEGEYREALGQLAEIEARIKISDRDKIDLISYSDAAKVEQERLRLDIARAEAKVALRRMAAANPGILRQRSFDETLASVADIRIGDLTNGDEGIEDKNNLFKKMKRKRVAMAAVKGIATGLLIGGLAQEATTFLSDQQHGLIERFFKGDQAGGQPKPGFTPLEFLRRWWSSELPKSAGGAGAGTFEKIIGNLRVKLPAGADLVFSQSDGTYTLMHNNSPYISGIKLNPDGTLTQDAANLLAAKGIAVQQSVDQIQRMFTDTDTVTSGPKEVVDQRPDLFKAIKRVLWYDNDTPKPVFDKNELRLHWGERGTGIDAKGNFVYDINAMTPDGSYHKNFSVDAQQAMKAGKLRLMISLSQDTQHRVFQVPIGADGRAVFDPNSDVGKMVFKEVNGKAQFLGRFAEVAEVVGEKDGVERMRILATHEGKGLDTVTETVQKPLPVIENSPKLIIGAPPEGDYQVLPPPVIPVFGRRPLERAQNVRETHPYYPSYYGAGSAEAILADFERRGIELDPYQVVEQNGGKVLLDKNGEAIERNVERERERIRSYLEGQDPAYRTELEQLSQGLPPMEENCRVVVTIPAKMEAVNLKNLLDQYKNQEDGKHNVIDLRTFEINIIVNKKKSEVGDNSMDVIEAWKRENPSFKVNAIDMSFDDNVACVGLARKYITDLSLLRSISRARQAGPVYIQSEDADLFSIDVRTVWKTVQDFDKNPRLDVLRGLQDRRPEILQKNDLLFFGRRLWDFAEVFLRSPKYRPENNPQADFVWHRIISGGWNTSFTAEAYSQIGGYNQHMRIGEDMDIGQKISVLRGRRDTATSKFTHNTWTAKASGLRSNSSPRRFVDALARDISPYDDFENQALKHAPLDELLRKIEGFAEVKTDHFDKYQDTISTLTTFIKRLSGDDASLWQSALKRTLGHMGLKAKTHYEITDNGIYLKRQGMAALMRQIRSYKTDKKWKLGYRRQNNPHGL